MNRRISGVLNTNFRALNGLLSASLGNSFTMNTDGRLRGHAFKLRKENFKTKAYTDSLSDAVFGRLYTIEMCVGRYSELLLNRSSLMNLVFLFEMQLLYCKYNTWCQM